MASDMSNVIRNSEVNDFYKANGKEKCTEYLKENDINFYTENVCADKMSYEYSLIKKTNSFKKGLSRPATKSKYETFLDSDITETSPCGT